MNYQKKLCARRENQKRRSPTVKDLPNLILERYSQTMGDQTRKRDELLVLKLIETVF